MKKILLIILILTLGLATTGCVRRIVTLESLPPGAQVYFDRKLVGTTPCEFEFLYYGSHHLELVKDGYKNLNTTLKLKGPFYTYFPLSLFSEVLLPWLITDKHSFTFTLEKGKSKKPVISPLTQPQPRLPAPRLERIEEKQ